jgi:chromosome condensin MukBEF complex kleisin-like MukF subunit
MGFFSRVILSDIPASFFSLVPERIDGAFASSHRRATMEGRVLPEQLAYARGADRHFAVQRGVVDAAVSLGAEKNDCTSGYIALSDAPHTYGQDDYRDLHHQLI